MISQKYSFILIFKALLFLFIFAPLFFSCNKFDGTQTIPAYIHIEKITLVDNPNINEGSLSNKITDAWVYVDDELIGAFQLPATFPVLKSGKHKISIHPGIKMNGMLGTRVEYEFYKNIDITDFNFVEDSIIKIDTLVTRTSYRDNLNLDWKEDFDDGTILFQKRTGSDTNIIQTIAPANLFEGTPTGIVNLDQNHTFFEIEPVGDNFVLPKNSSPVFLEMNYKTNNSFYVGLLVYSSSSQTIPSAKVSTIALYPSSEWKKIYINFTPDVSDYYNATSFKFFIGGYKDDGIQNAEILFDNIKMVYFKTSK
ncbi:MAG: hypothetical protein HXX18_05405 [Bacteroidetes bacterium]|nr:hypothetical protein [Bacteroidota bacterium]